LAVLQTDDSRAELPLTADKQETFPIGFVLETGCTKRLIIDENERPVMPMIHLMSTHGQLLSFTVLNSKPNYMDICSPPRPLPNSAQSLFVEAAPVATEIEAPPSSQQQIPQPAATSTPQVAKSKSFFSPAEPKSATNLFGMGTASTASIFGVGQPASAAPPPLSFGMSSIVGGGDAKPSFFGMGATDKPSGSLFASIAPTSAPAPAPLPSFGSLAPAKPTTTAPPPFSAQPKEVVPSNKPLITVPPTYSQSTQPSQPAEQPAEPVQPKATVKSEEDNKIIRLMIAEELQTIEKDLKNLLARSKSLNVTIGTTDESSQMIRTLDGLQEWGKDALENTDTLAVDIQQLRLGINETFQMVAEAKSKFAMYHDAK
jgi:nuclear pore complex protein Nup214